MSNEAKSEVKKEMKIDPAYQGYVFLGWAPGLFELKSGEKRPYYNMYVFSPVSDYVSDEYEASGFKAEKKNKLTERWNATGRETTPEELFSFAMTMDGDYGMKQYLDVVERFLERKGV